MPETKESSQLITMISPCYSSSCSEIKAVNLKECLAATALL